MEKKYIPKGKIANALTSVAKDHIVATTDDIFDERLQEYQSEINKQIIGGDKSLLMLKDGSNYEGEKKLTTPYISVEWEITEPDGKTYTTDEKYITVGKGSIVSVSARVENRAQENEIQPYKLNGDFGSIEVDKNNETLQTGTIGGIEMNNISDSVIFSATFYGKGGYLKANDNKYIYYESDDLTSSSVICVNFKHIVYWGISDCEYQDGFDITKLENSGFTANSFRELSKYGTASENSFKFIFDCTGGKYIFFAYPTVLGEVHFELGGIPFSNFNDPIIINVNGINYTLYTSVTKYHSNQYPLKFIL